MPILRWLFVVEVNEQGLAVLGPGWLAICGTSMLIACFVLARDVLGWAGC